MTLDMAIASGPQGATLSRKAKAAIIVQFLLSEGADVPIAALPEKLQLELTQQLGAMRYVDRDTLNAVLEEFTAELDAIGLRLPGGLPDALNALAGKVDPALERRLRRANRAIRPGDPWDQVRALPAAKLCPLVLAESVEVGAIIVSKLEVEQAADLLSRLPGERARRITYAVSRTAQVAPDAVMRIGRSLASQIETAQKKEFDESAVERVGEILNFSSTTTRETMLEGLRQTDPDFAEAVRRAIFTFANLPERVDPRDVPKIPRDVEQRTIVTALAGATDEAEQIAAEFILENMSKRMAQALRDEAADMGTVERKDAEAAMNQIVSALRDMAASGEIRLRKPGETD